jgi:hypothetical protein
VNYDLLEWVLCHEYSHFNGESTDECTKCSNTDRPGIVLEEKVELANSGLGLTRGFACEWDTNFVLFLMFFFL